MRSKIMVVMLTGLLCTFHAAASEQTGKIQSIEAMNDGRIAVTMQQGTRTAKPDCAAYDYWFINDENSNAGKAQLALILSAQASGSDIHIAGMNQCMRFVDGENIASVTIK